MKKPAAKTPKSNTTSKAKSKTSSALKDLPARKSPVGGIRKQEEADK